MNKLIQKTLALAIIMLLSQTSMATDVTSNFNTGDTLTATQMTEIKSAVNSKQNIVTGTCATGSSIRAIATNGTVTCDPTAGTKLVGYQEFQPWWGNETECTRGTLSNGYFYYTTASTLANCGAFATVDLNNGATITSVSCQVYDNTAVGSAQIFFYRVSSTGNLLSLGSSSSSIDSTTTQTLTVTLAHTVDNTYSYFVYLNMPNPTSAGNNARIYSCTIQ